MLAIVTPLAAADAAKEESSNFLVSPNTTSVQTISPTLGLTRKLPDEATGMARGRRR